MEPHAVSGVTLTATDGHRLIHMWDEYGEANESGIISLSAAALKECKSGRHGKRILFVAEGASVHEQNVDGTLGDVVAVSPKCRIDGTFPDYRRVVPKIRDYVEKQHAPHFDGRILGTFCDIAVELVKERGKLAKETGYSSESESKPLVRVHGDWTSPSIVLFANEPRAFGVIMPCSYPSKSMEMPSWFGAVKKESVAA